MIKLGKPITIAGAAYAAFWVVVIGARLLFTYGANHWYTQSLGHWLATNRITDAGLTDGLILFAIGMVLARVIRFARILHERRTVGAGSERLRSTDHGLEEIPKVEVP